MAENGRREWLLDLDAFIPEPRGYIPIPVLDVHGHPVADAQGQMRVKAEHAVYSFLDLPLSDAIRSYRIDEQRLGLPFPERVEGMREQVRLSCPTIPEDDLARLSPHLILRVRDIAVAPKVPKDIGDAIRAALAGVPDGQIASVLVLVREALEAAREEIRTELRPPTGSGAVPSVSGSPSPALPGTSPA